MSFDVKLPYSTASRTCNTLLWILVSHQPDDVIIVSSGSSLETDFDDQFIQPPTEQVLLVISNVKTSRHTRLMPANHWRCKLCKNTLKLHQKCPSYSSAMIRPHTRVINVCSPTMVHKVINTKKGITKHGT